MLRANIHLCSPYLHRWEDWQLTETPGMDWRGKYHCEKKIAPWNSSCGRLSVKARAEVTHCYAHCAPWFLIKWNCIGTRCAFKPRPNRIPSPPPLLSGQEWCNSGNFMIHWMQLLDLSVFWASFVCDVCSVQTQPLLRLFTYSVSLPHTGTISHMVMHVL